MVGTIGRRSTSSTLALTGEQRDEVLWLAVQIATWRGEGRPEQWIKRKLAGFRAATARTRLCERLGVLLRELERSDDEPTPELIAFVQQKIDTGFSRAHKSQGASSLAAIANLSAPSALR